MEHELYHHGILGMKWGIRRFQKKDGSLTNLGKKRRAADDEDNDKKAAKEAEKKRIEEETRARILKSNNAQEIYENRHLLTTQEINERLTRIDTERRLGAEAEKNKVTIGGWIKKVVNKASDAAATMETAYQVTQKPFFKAFMKAMKGEDETKAINYDEVRKNIDKMSTSELNETLTRIKNINSIENLIDKIAGRR